MTHTGCGLTVSTFFLARKKKTPETIFVFITILPTSSNNDNYRSYRNDGLCIYVLYFFLVIYFLITLIRLFSDTRNCNIISPDTPYIFILKCSIYSRSRFNPQPSIAFQFFFPSKIQRSLNRLRGSTVHNNNNNTQHSKNVHNKHQSSK